MPLPDIRPAWRIVNTWSGHVVFGLPAVLAVPALVSTVTRFGWGHTLTTGLPAAAWACIPLLLWILYLRNARRRTVWVLLLAIATVVLLLSPIYFWAAPAMVVLLMEAARGLATRGLRSQAPSRWVHRQDEPGSDLAVPKTPGEVSQP